MKDDERKNAKIRSAICPQCGGPVERNSQGSNAICQYCGSQITAEKVKTGALESILNFINERQKRIDDAKKEKAEKVKPSALESVLNFVKEQQKRIDDIKKKKEEEERKKREDAKKFFGVYLLVMFILLGALLFMGDEEEKNSEISINHSSSQLVGKNYKDVVVKLQENGFTNIKTEAVEDLIIGLFTTDGEVEQVEIDGDIDFNSGAKFPKDAEIIVSYHTFPATK